MKEIDKIVEEFENHPALVFANDAITLQAIRSGTKGYTGKENLVEFLEKALITIYNKGKEEEKEKIAEELKKILPDGKWDLNIHDVLKVIYKEQ